MQTVIDHAIDATEARMKLASLSLYMDSAKNEFYEEFGAYMSGKLAVATILPIKYIELYEEALEELQRGTTQKVFKVIKGYEKITKNSPGFYAALKARMALIAEAVFPAEFAKEVRIVIEATNAQVTATAA